MKESLNAICFGEILWDVFPDGKALGGAPLNLCTHASTHFLLPADD